MYGFTGNKICFATNSNVGMITKYLEKCARLEPKHLLADDYNRSIHNLIKIAGKYNFSKLSSDFEVFHT